MIKVDENEPLGEIELSFPYRDVQIRRNADPKDEYNLEEEIGRGKFGTVYRCTEKSSGLNLAAKFIACPKKEDRRNVEREIDIMRQLQHPRLIQIYDAFENGKVMCVILELIEGGELFERVIDDDFILTEKACTVFMRQICEGIDFIHQQRILHLDMKPENILCLTKTGNRIKIIDFGLARKFDPSKKLQVLFGTPEFAAPEVVNFDEIGYGTDMWSLGVICYVLLSGLSPFMGSTDVETMANVTIGKYDFDDEAFEQISENAKDFIRKLLIKDLNARLTAQQCLAHPWLARRRTLPPRTSSMEVTKENLRQFVERWNEHPNSPYIFEIDPNTLESPFSSEGTATSSSHSLVGDSPSPCGSIASSPGSDNAFAPTNDNHLLFLPSPELFRRASDSTCLTSKPDITERINLADEIKKLSDKLYRLSSIDTSLNNDRYLFDGDTFKIDRDKLRLDADKRPLDVDKSRLDNDKRPLDDDKRPLDVDKRPLDVDKRPSDIDKSRLDDDKRTSDNDRSPLDGDRPPMQRNVVNGFMSRILPKDHPDNPKCNIPWRRTKFKMSITSRDVPLAARIIHKCSNQFTTRTNGSFQCESLNETKDLLLQLLEHWDGPTGPRNSRHSSVSSEWSESETLGQRTISSLNTFFQKRATNKKITPFHFNKT